MFHAHMCSVIPVDTHTLPGLCHSAAVAAAARRAPAQPQLLLRLTPIKVVCEFSKTRHLSCGCSPAVLEVFQHFNLFFFFFLVLNPLFLVRLCHAAKQPLDFYQGLVLAAGPSLLMSLHSFDALPLLCRRTIPTTLCYFFFPPSGSSDQPPLPAECTHTYAHTDSLKIVTLGTAYQSTQR